MLQILVETIIPVLLGISMALFIGNLLADFISANLIRQELMASQMQQHQNTPSFNFGFYSVFLDNHLSSALTSNEVRLTGEQIAWFYTLGISITIFSLGIAMILLMRLNPKKILLKL